MDFTDDVYLLEELKKENPEAWGYALYRAARTVICREHMRKMLDDFNFEEYDVYSMLYNKMIGEKKLWKFGFNGSLIGFLKAYTAGLIRQCCKKNPHPVSDLRFTNTFLDEEHENGAAAFPHQYAERREVAAKCFSQLWKENPMRAHVLLLKTRYSMSSKEIQNLLGISSAYNVDQIFSRAIQDMRRIRRIYE